jgi:hypothetical protein
MLADRVITAVSPTTKTNGIRLCQRVTKPNIYTEERDINSVTLEEYTMRDDLVSQFTIQVKDIPAIVAMLNEFKVDKRVKKKRLVRVTLVK